MSVRTAGAFFRAHWLSLSLLAGIMGLYFTSAILHGDYLYVLAGALFVAAAVGFLWWRFEA
ncbi:hypothetical protein [Natronorarus salvus]|uniref:hypothetical protein n=1 Tax=Natronorarus salvus TaxID=3117733 RepID=UPI002F264640